MPLVHPGLEEVGLKVDPIGYIHCIIMVSPIWRNSYHSNQTHRWIDAGNVCSHLQLPLEVSMGCNYSQSSGTHTQPGSRQSWKQRIFSWPHIHSICSRVLQLKDQRSLILLSHTSMCLTLPTVDTFTKDN